MGIPENDYQLLNAAVQSSNKEEYIRQWLTRELWEDYLDNPTALCLIDGYLSMLWDAAHMTVREIYKKSGLRQADIAYRLCIPLRRVEDWCSGGHNPPDHVRIMMLRILLLLPSYSNIKHSLSQISNLSEFKVKQLPKKEEQYMKKSFNVTEHKHWEAEVRIADLMAAGVDINYDAITDAGLDIQDLPPVRILATAENTQVTPNAPIIKALEFYYGFVGFGDLFRGFGLPLDNNDVDPASVFPMWIDTVLDQIVWEDMAQLL